MIRGTETHMIKRVPEIIPMIPVIRPTIARGFPASFFFRLIAPRIIAGSPVSAPQHNRERMPNTMEMIALILLGFAGSAEE
jgi:hypothetical protein